MRRRDLAGPGVQGIHCLGDRSGQRSEDTGPPGSLLDLAQGADQFISELVLNRDERLGTLDEPLVLAPRNVVHPDALLERREGGDRTFRCRTPGRERSCCAFHGTQRVTKIDGLDEPGQRRRRRRQKIHLTQFQQALGMFDEQRARCCIMDPAAIAFDVVLEIETEEAGTIERADVPPLAVGRLHGPHPGGPHARHPSRRCAGLAERVDQCAERIICHARRVAIPGALLSDRMATAHPRGLPSASELATRIGALIDTDSRHSPPASRRLAAVLILLYDRDETPHVVLTKRTDTLEHHPGQVSLPGGRWETGDGDLGTTALRETHEELGIPPESVQLVGRLGDELTMVSGFVVAPFVGVSSAAVHPVPSEMEIARVLEIPLTALLEADDALPAHLDVATLRYPLLDEDVWGATARILHAFSGVVRTALDGG